MRPVMKHRAAQEKRTAVQHGKYTFHKFQKPDKFDRCERERNHSKPWLMEKDGKLCCSQSKPEKKDSKFCFNQSKPVKESKFSNSQSKPEKRDSKLRSKQSKPEKDSQLCFSRSRTEKDSQRCFSQSRTEKDSQLCFSQSRREKDNQLCFSQSRTAEDNQLCFSQSRTEKDKQLCLSQSMILTATESCNGHQKDSQGSYDFRKRHFDCLPTNEKSDFRQSSAGERFVSSQSVSYDNDRTVKYRFNPYKNSSYHRPRRTACQMATERTYSRRQSSRSQKTLSLSQTTLGNDTTTQLTDPSQGNPSRKRWQPLEPFIKRSPPCWTLGGSSRGQSKMSMRRIITEKVSNGLNKILKVLHMIYTERKKREKNEEFEAKIDSDKEKLASLRQNLDDRFKSMKETVETVISRRCGNKSEDTTKCLPRDYLHEQEFLLENTRIVTKDTLERLTKYQESVEKQQQTVERELKEIDYIMHEDSTDEDSSNENSLGENSRGEDSPDDDSQ